MNKPYDATSKDLIESDPAGWVTFLGCPVPPAAVKLEDAGLSTVTTDADKVIRVDHPTPWLLHLEIQANSDDALPRRLLQYNALLQHRHGVPVATAVVVLRPSIRLSGRWATASPVGPAWEFAYDVVRVWERPADDFLTGPLGVLPLAPLADVRRPDLPGVVSRMKDRIDRDAPRPLGAKLWAATYVLLGLRYEDAVADSLLSGVLQMEESTTYQAILRRGAQQGRQEGRAEQAQALLRQGRKKFGPPSAEQEAALAAITDVPRLEALGENLLDVSTWDDLLKPE